MNFLEKLFGKKKETFDFNHNSTVWDLKKGYFLEYFLEAWQVVNEFSYDWGNNFYSKEFELDNGKEHIFLHILNENGLKCSLSREVSIKTLNPMLKNKILEYKEPFKSIEYQGETYHIEEKHNAYVSTVGESGESELTTWDYTNNDEKKTITINQWGKSSIEAYAGVVVQPYEFSNISPAAE